MAVNKVIYGGNVLIDLTADTVSASKVLRGYTAHDKSGAAITGSCTFDADTQGATATPDEILLGETAFVNGAQITGTMPNNGAVAGIITQKSQAYVIPVGYHDGSGTVQIDATQQALLVPSNIRSGITVLGVTGTMSGAESVTAQAKTVTPSTSQQIVTPDAGYNYLSQVTVNAIPYTEAANSAGGMTVTIG